MARSINESKFLLVKVSLECVGPYLLCYISKFLINHMRVPEGIQNCGLSMVDMTHYSNYRCPVPEILLIIYCLNKLYFSSIVQTYCFNLV